MQTLHWTTSTGLNIAVTVSTGYGLDRSGNTKLAGRKQVNIEATIDGTYHSCMAGLVAVKNHPLVVSSLGKIGLTAANDVQVRAAIAAAESSIAAHNKAIAAHESGLDALGTGDINKTFGRHC